MRVKLNLLSIALLFFNLPALAQNAPSINVPESGLSGLGREGLQAAAGLPQRVNPIPQDDATPSTRTYPAGSQPAAVAQPIPSQQPATPSTGSISGHVFRADTGAPLAGAMLTLIPDPRTDPYHRVVFLGVRTGPDGAYKFASLDPSTYALRVEDAGFVTGDRRPPIVLAAGQDIGNVDFQLQLAGVISGCVLDQSNQPIAGNFVRAMYRDSYVRGETALTDDRGEFRISGISPGECYVIAGAPGVPATGEDPTYYPSADSREHAQLVEVKSGAETSNINITLTNATAPIPPRQSQPPGTPTDSGGSISGHVYRADTGAPLAGALVFLRFLSASMPARRGPIPPEMMRTGPDGSYKFESLKSGSYSVEVQHVGFLAVSYTQRGEGGTPPRQIPVVGGASVADIDVRLPLAGVITGTVRDQNNVPLEGMVVDVRSQSAENPTNGGFAYTDDQGNFRYPVRAPGDYFIVVGPPPGSALTEMGYRTAYYPNAASLEKAQPLHVEPGVDTSVHLTVSYSPTFMLAVKILGAASPDSNIRYRVSAAPTDTALGTSILQGAPGPWVIALPDGTATLRGLTAGSYRVSLLPMMLHTGLNGQVGMGGAGQSVGSAMVQILNSDTTVAIPVSSFPAGGRPQ